MEGPLGEYLMSKWQAKADEGVPAGAPPGAASAEADMRPADAPSTSANPPRGAYTRTDHIPTYLVEWGRRPMPATRAASCVVIMAPALCSR